MRIAMISPLEMRVPPTAYGGTELVVSLLTEGLVRQGHHVTLFASGDSSTYARLIPGCEESLRGKDRDKPLLNMLNVLNCVERAGEFDIIHNHTSLEGLSVAGLIETPMLTTLHGGISGDFRLLFERYSGWFNAISRSAMSLLPPKARSAGVVYNAIDCDSYPFAPSPHEDFLLFLSRISYERGTHFAIEVARRAGRKLIIAGNVDDPDRSYFETMVAPELDDPLIEYVGEADFDTKRDLMKRADCLLAPITWNEPFGLFLVEAMVCGTPVVAFRRGSIPEVIDEGITGYVVDTIEEMGARLNNISNIDRAQCRAVAATRFDTPRMVNDYMEAYRRILSSQHSRVEMDFQPMVGVPG